MRSNQCTEGTIIATGVYFNWLTYLLNELLEDVEEVQEKGNPFHYSQLLILIYFVTWEKPPNYQWVDVPFQCRGARQQNLWFEKEKPEQQRDNNVEFYLQAEVVRNFVRKQL